VHHRPHLTAALAVLLASGLAACSRAPQPAPSGATPACTHALAAAPRTVLGKARTALAVQGALGWGDPQIVLRCGLAALGPTTAQCLEVNGIDWVVADPDADPIVFSVYGRSPAVDLSVPAAYGRSTASGALVDVAGVAAALPTTGRTCQ
jgi:Protein of unknown function (DUF3515)